MAPAKREQPVGYSPGFQQMLTRERQVRTMCGFVGYIDGGDTLRDEGVLHSMADAIRHRGPDDADYYMDGTIALGSGGFPSSTWRAGASPSSTRTAQKCSPLMGRFTTIKRLKRTCWRRATCLKPPPTPRCCSTATRSTAPSVKQAAGHVRLCHLGQGEAGALRARDFFGIKPLYYAQMNGTLLFGSEIKSFLHHPHFVKELNEKALENYLSSVLPRAGDFFKTCTRCPRGTTSNTRTARWS